MKKNIVLIISLLFICKLFAQNAPMAYPSPEAASLGIAGNIPVSYYTGKMNLSIPLLDLKADNYEMPISLSYNSSGFMPNLVNGWVGQNWTLNAGGVITRVVKGLPDELPVWGYFYTYQHISDLNWYAKQDQTHGQGSEHPEFDAEADEFYFNVNGISGKFYLNNQGTFTVISEPGITVSIHPYENLKSIDNPVGKYTEKTFYGFDIKTMDGTLYHFGFADKIVETSSSEGEGTSWNWNRAVATSWYLAEIVLMQRAERIKFTYSSKYFDVEKVQTYANNQETLFIDFGLHDPCPSSGGSSVSYSYINHVYLKSIESSIFKVNFYTSDMNFQDYFTYPSGFTHHWQKLDSIVLQSKNPERKMKKIDFDYETRKRAFLKSVQTEGMPPYEFEYYANNFHNPFNIGFDTRKIDHWGYYNGSVMYQGQEPPPIALLAEEFYYGGNVFFFPGREAEPDFVRFGMLEKIKYPTGAEKTIEYECNDYSSYFYIPHLENTLYPYNVERTWSEWKSTTLVTGRQEAFTTNYPAYSIIEISFPYSSAYPTKQIRYFKKQAEPLTLREILFMTDMPEDLFASISIQYREFQPSINAFAGGTRIKKITTTEGNSTTIKEYKYVKDYSPTNNQSVSSGILSSFPVYSFGRLPWGENIVSTDFSPVRYHWVFRRSSSYTPLNLTGGYNVGYSEVAEITKTDTGNSLGYVVYKYTNYNIFPDVAGYPVSSVLYGPAEFSYGTDLGVRTNMDFRRGKLKSERKYSSNNVLIDETEYEYTHTFRDEINFIHFAYFPQTPCTANDRNTKGAYDYLIKNDSYLLQSETNTNYGVNGESPVQTASHYESHNYNQIIKSTVTDSDGSVFETQYKYPTDYSVPPYTDMSDSFNHFLSLVIEKAIYKNNTFVSKEKWEYKNFGNFFPEYYKIQYGTGALETKVQYHKYDSYGNPLYVSTDGTNTVYLWTYGQFLQAIIQNATADEVSQHLGELMLSRHEEPDMSEVEILRTLLPQAQVTTFKYMPLTGVVEITDPRGVTTYYDYDSFGRLKESYYYKNGTKKVLERYDYHYKDQ